jgi:zinc protease
MRRTNRLLIALFSLPLLLLGSQPLLANPQIQQWQTSNGARVYFVAAPELPMIDIRVVFDAGSARDGKQPGLALFTSAMLEEGAAGLNADTIASRFEDLGAQFSAGAYRDMATVGLRSLSKKAILKPALKTFIQVLSKPDFPTKALARVRKQMLTGLQQEEQQPESIAEKAFYKALYGDHPYAIPSDGTIKSVKAMQKKDLRDFYQRYYVAHNAVIAIVGALDEAEAKRLAEEVTAGLHAGKVAADLPQPAVLKQAKTQHIEYPSSQTHILMGQPGIARGDKDYFPLYVGNHILGGGGFGSRLTTEVREKRGLSYSVYSYFAPMHAAGPFVLGLQTRNDSADKALKVLRDTLVKFRSEGPTAKELDAAKKNITGGFPLKVDSNSDILGYIAMIGFYGLPLDYLDRFNARIEAVTAEQIRDAFQRRVDPAHMVTITVGKRQ